MRVAVAVTCPHRASHSDLVQTPTPSIGELPLLQPLQISATGNSLLPIDHRGRRWIQSGALRARTDYSLRIESGGIILRPSDQALPSAELQGVERLQFGTEIIDLSHSEAGAPIRLYSSLVQPQPGSGRDQLLAWRDRARRA